MVRCPRKWGKATCSATTLPTIVALPRPSSLPPNGRTANEKIIWQLTATLVQYKREDDGDYHLVLRDGTTGRTMIAEIADPGCVANGGRFLSFIQRARVEFDREFSVTTSWKSAGLAVQIAGIGFFDYPHGQTGYADNGIELHPVLDVAIYPASYPQEVSDDVCAAVPLTISKAPGSGLTFRFEYTGPGRYDIYGAPTSRFPTAQATYMNWATKICDLEHNALGTWTADGASFASFTLTDASSLPPGDYVVIQTSPTYGEGPYGHRSNGWFVPTDSNRSGDSNVGCP